MADAPSSLELRQARAENPRAHDREFAGSLGVSEARLAAAHIGGDGERSVRIAASPDRIIPAAETLGEVLALTRNDSCVSESVGTYANWHSGDHAAMVLGEEIDLRIFPSQWVHAFAVEKQSERGVRRSLQVFDAAGDSVHKIHLRDGSDIAAWDAAVAALRLDDQTDTVDVTPRRPPEAAQADITKLDILRKEWARMTDTHQFLRLTSKLKMNRLGAYRIVGEDFARPLATSSISAMLNGARDNGVGVMVFVGNRGCIQIRSGQLVNVTPMGPWLNVLDPRFDLHLRGDHVAEVWAVTKPTKRGPALSVEAFTADGSLIAQVFAVARDGDDHRDAWAKLVDNLPVDEVVS